MHRFWQIRKHAAIDKDAPFCTFTSQRAPVFPSNCVARVICGAKGQSEWAYVAMKFSGQIGACGHYRLFTFSIHQEGNIKYTRAIGQDMRMSDG